VYKCKKEKPLQHEVRIITTCKFIQIHKVGDGMKRIAKMCWMQPPKNPGQKHRGVFMDYFRALQNLLEDHKYCTGKALKKSPSTIRHLYQSNHLPLEQLRLFMQWE